MRINPIKNFYPKNNIAFKSGFMSWGMDDDEDTSFGPISPRKLSSEDIDWNCGPVSLCRIQYPQIIVCTPARQINHDRKCSISERDVISDDFDYNYD